MCGQLEELYYLTLELLSSHILRCSKVRFLHSCMWERKEHKKVKKLIGGYEKNNSSLNINKHLQKEILKPYHMHILKRITQQAPLKPVSFLSNVLLSVGCVILRKHKEIIPYGNIKTLPHVW